MKAARGAMMILGIALNASMDMDLMKENQVAYLALILAASIAETTTLSASNARQDFLWTIAANAQEYAQTQIVPNAT